MAKPLRGLCIAFILVALLGGAAWLLLNQPQTKTTGAETQALLQKQMVDVASVTVQNQHGRYTVTQSGNQLVVHDLPAELVNLEYVAMLLDECSNILYTQQVEQNPADLTLYGLADPVSTVDISYTDGQNLRLLFGTEEPVSGGRYFKTADSPAVLLMKNNRTIRFTMPVERYINYIIIPPNTTPSILSAVQDITFSGSKLPHPIVLKAVLEDREEILRISSSFGAATHIIVEPELHEANQTELIRLTDSLLGLISEGVVAYNCTPEQLSAYGFDQPVLQVEFDVQYSKDAPVEHHLLRLSTLDGGYIATLDDWGVVYKIAPVDFTTVNYEALVLRWFLSPFLTDVAQLEVSFGADHYLFDIQSETAQQVSASWQGTPLESDLFRRYYNLVVSAAASETLPPGTTPQGDPVATLRFGYKDPKKPDDIIRLYQGDTRRLLVEVNGLCSSAMRDRYLEVLQAATQALLDGQTFAINW